MAIDFTVTLVAPFRSPELAEGIVPGLLKKSEYSYDPETKTHTWRVKTVDETPDTDASVSSGV